MKARTVKKIVDNRLKDIFMIIFIGFVTIAAGFVFVMLSYSLGELNEHTRITQCLSKVVIVGGTFTSESQEKVYKCLTGE